MFPSNQFKARRLVIRLTTITFPSLFTLNSQISRQSRGTRRLPVILFPASSETVLSTEDGRQEKKGRGEVKCGARTTMLGK